MRRGRDHRWMWVVVCAASACVGPRPASGEQPDPAQASAAIDPAASSGEEGWAALEARLERLDPSRPIEYFELAEDFAAYAGERPAARERARQLYVLSWLLGLAEAGANGAGAEEGERSGARERAERGEIPRERLGVSVCLGLAEVSSTPAERRWLLALASASEPETGVIGADGSEAVGDRSSASAGGVGGVEPAAYELATALGLLRGGEGRRALKSLERPEVLALLKRYERLLSPAGADGGAERVLTMATRAGGGSGTGSGVGCPECRNRRAVKTSRGWELCGLCRGHPGPELGRVELVLQLRFEAVLLNASQSSWAAQTIIDAGEPLRDPDPADLAARYGVSAERPVFRRGGWAAVRAEAPLPGAPEPGP